MTWWLWVLVAYFAVTVVWGYGCWRFLSGVPVNRGDRHGYLDQYPLMHLWMFAVCALYWPVPLLLYGVKGCWEEFTR